MSTLRHDRDDDDDVDSAAASFHTARSSTSSFNSSAAMNNIDDDDVSFQKSTHSGDSGMEVDMWSSRNQDDDGSGSLLMQHYLRGKMLRKLRQDKNGDTYLAELNNNKRTRTLYAIKTMHKGMKMLCRMSRSLIETERNVLKSLRHPFLPTVHADVESEDFLFLVMDFCPGGDLRALLRTGGALREEAVKFYAVEVLLALEYLHMYGIVHRDLKPENVLIKADGHIMLSGFDRAQFFRELHDAEGRRPSESQDGRIISDVRIPPEVFKGEEHDNRADLYTFGVFVYELLLGTTPPLHDVDRRTTCMGLGAQRVKFPEKPALSPAAQDLVRRLMEKDPRRRLGHKHGTADVKRHAFFRGINFAFLQSIADGCLRPPRLPNKFYKRK